MKHLIEWIIILVSIVSPCIGKFEATNY